MARVREILLPWDSPPQEACGVNWDDPISQGLLLLHTGSRTFGPSIGLSPGVPDEISPLPDRITAYGPGWVGNGGARYMEIPVQGIAPRSTPFTMACLSAPATTATQTTVSISGKSGSNRCQINSSGSDWQAFTSTGVAFSNTGSASVGRYDFVAADFGMGVADSSIVWVNGKPGFLSNVNTDAGTYTTLAIGARWNSGYGLYGNGRTALVLLWNRLLTAQEHVELASDPWRLFSRQSIWVPVSGGAPAGISATLTQILAGATVSAASTLALKGAVSQTLADATTTATCTLALKGVTTQTLAGATLAATGTLALKGVVTQTLANATLAATGALAVSGSGVLVATLADATVASTGTVALKAAVTQTLANATLVSTAKLAIKGATSQTLAGATLSAQGTAQQVTIGTAAITLGAATVAATGKLPITGTTTRTLADATLAATATMPLAGISAAVGATLGDATLDASATVLLKGSAAITLGDCTIVATGAEGVIVPVIFGSLVGSTQKAGFGRPASVSAIARTTRQTIRR